MGKSLNRKISSRVENIRTQDTKAKSFTGQTVTVIKGISLI